MSNDIIHFLPDGAHRIDLFLSNSYPDLGRSKWNALIKSGKVKIDGKIVIKPGAHIAPGSTLEAIIPDIVSSKYSLEFENINMSSVFEDDYLLIVNKLAGMVMHPGPGHPSGTVLNAVLDKININSIEDLNNNYSSDKVWPGLVHRLDRYTTGCLIIAKNEKVQKSLRLQFKNRTVEKCYLALSRTSCKLSTVDYVNINGAISRHRSNRLKMAISTSGRPSVTRAKTLEESCGISLVECRPLTGRTHQVRLHLSSFGAPILGDSLYGGPLSWFDVNKLSFNCPNYMLHAWKICIDHPETGKRIEAVSPLPYVYKNILDSLGITNP